MIINSNTKIVGNKVELVPYLPKHVPKYHQWMKSEELQHLTGSEPLTLEEEYAMQKSWREDEDKCTFIVLSRNSSNSDGEASEEREVNAMIGDTNIFIAKDDDTGLTVGEAEIMIAEESARGQKMGKEAMVLMLIYGIDFLKINRFEAKIKLDNPTSIGMFDRLGFQETSRSEVFGEVTLSVTVSDEWRKILTEQLQWSQNFDQKLTTVDYHSTSKSNQEVS